MNSVMVLKTETERKRKREIVEKQKRLLLIDRGFNIFLFSYNEFHSWMKNNEGIILRWYIFSNKYQFVKKVIK